MYKWFYCTTLSLHEHINLNKQKNGFNFTTRYVSPNHYLAYEVTMEGVSHSFLLPYITLQAKVR